jgi:hypothetical protein
LKKLAHMMKAWTFGVERILKCHSGYVRKMQLFERIIGLLRGH